MKDLAERKRVMLNLSRGRLDAMNRNPPTYEKMYQSVKRGAERRNEDASEEVLRYRAQIKYDTAREFHAFLKEKVRWLEKQTSKTPE